MCHFLAPVGQPEMMHKNFMRRHLRISVARCSGMKFFAHFQLNTPQIKPLVSLRISGFSVSINLTPVIPNQ